MAGPQPVAVDNDTDDDDDDESSVKDAVDQKLDELQSAEEEAQSATDPGGSDGDIPFDGDEAEEIDLDLAETNVGDEIEDDPFEGTDDSAEDPFDGEESGSWDGAGEGEFGDKMADAGMGLADGTLPTTLNEGAAKLAVLGLPDEFEHHGETKTKEELQDEFEEVFETFKLGDFGAEVAEEYLFVEDDGVDPLVAFCCSLALCTVIVAMSRPDSDEIVSKAKSRFGSAAGGVSLPGGI